jgi:hypothetical protein
LCAVQLVVQKSWKTASLTEVTWKWEQTACWTGRNKSAVVSIVVNVDGPT